MFRNMEAVKCIQESERLIRIGHYDEAIALLTTVLEEDPLNLSALLNIGVAFTESGRNEAALQALSFYLRHDQDNGDAWEAIGCAHLRSKEFDRAEECFQRAIEIDPENASVLRNYSVLLSRTDRGRESYQMLRKSHDINPDDSLTAFALASSYRYLGRKQEALDLYGKLIELRILPDQIRLDIERNIVELSVGW